jgi:hypothetical protein
MTEPSSNRREFLKTTSALAASVGLLPNAHAKGTDTIKVGLIGCGGRGTGAAENICEAAGTSFNIKLHSLADIFDDRLKNCRDHVRNSEHCKDKFDVNEERCFVGFDAYQKVIDCCDLVMLATPPGFRPLHIEATIKAGKNLFCEKPVGSTAPASAKSWPLTRTPRPRSLLSSRALNVAMRPDTSRA